VGFTRSGFANDNRTFALLVRIAFDVVDDGLEDFVNVPP
jgi:hypothetical protein